MKLILKTYCNVKQVEVDKEVDAKLEQRIMGRLFWPFILKSHPETLADADETGYGHYKYRYLNSNCRFNSR